MRVYLGVEYCLLNKSSKLEGTHKDDEIVLNKLAGIHASHTYTKRSE